VISFLELSGTDFLSGCRIFFSLGTDFLDSGVNSLNSGIDDVESRIDDLLLVV
jgi:hypothetical protein